MSCYSPLRAMVLGYKPDGKKILKIIPQSKFNEMDHDGVEFINLPCGKCIGCRLDYSRSWADRCMAEASYHDSNLFLTLTYNDLHIPECNTYLASSEEILVDPDNAIRLSPIHPLVKRDLQLFIKRLRKRFPDQKIRYFACGEYGGTSMRPHYHLILFGLKLPDLVFSHTNEQLYRYYTSDTIKELWYREGDDRLDIDSRSAGFHIITDVNWSVCAYVARYIVKKQKGENASIYEDFNFPPEFTLMSRKPGIARQFYEDHKLKIYEDDMYIPTQEGARLIRPNKYFDSLFDIEYPELMIPIRDDRKKIALVNEQLKSSLTNLEYLDRLKAEETVHRDRVKILKRKEL